MPLDAVDQPLATHVAKLDMVNRGPRGQRRMHPAIAEIFQVSGIDDDIADRRRIGAGDGNRARDAGFAGDVFQRPVSMELRAHFRAVPSQMTRRGQPLKRSSTSRNPMCQL